MKLWSRTDSLNDINMRHFPMADPHSESLRSRANTNVVGVKTELFPSVFMNAAVKDGDRFTELYSVYILGSSA